MYYSDDPVRDFEEYDRARQERLARYPICKVCREHIQDEKCYLVDGRYFICLECCEEVDTEDYVDED
jgi:hypothetical protein